MWTAKENRMSCVFFAKEEGKPSSVRKAAGATVSGRTSIPSSLQSQSRVAVLQPECNAIRVGLSTHEMLPGRRTWAACTFNTTASTGRIYRRRWRALDCRVRLLHGGVGLYRCLRLDLNVVVHRAHTCHATGGLHGGPGGDIRHGSPS